MARLAIKSLAVSFSSAGDGVVYEVLSTGVLDYPDKNAILIKGIRWKIVDDYTHGMNPDSYSSLIISVGAGSYGTGDKRNLLEQHLIQTVNGTIIGEGAGYYVPPNNLIVASDHISVMGYSSGTLQPHTYAAQIFFEYVKIPLVDELFLSID